MAKRTTVSVPDPNDDVDILVKGLETIEQGILNGDTSLVVNGYNLISDKGLEWPIKKTPSKLDMVREKLANKPQKQKTPKKQVVSDDIDITEVDDLNIPIKEEKNGGMLIISSQEDADEIMANKKKANKIKLPPAPRRTALPKDTSHLDPNNTPVRLSMNNTPPNRRPDKENDE